VLLLAATAFEGVVVRRIEVEVAATLELVTGNDA
jgi:hypothetical protein